MQRVFEYLLSAWQFCIVPCFLLLPCFFLNFPIHLHDTSLSWCRRCSSHILSTGLGMFFCFAQQEVMDFSEQVESGKLP